MIKYASLANCGTFLHQCPLFFIIVQCKQQIWCVCVCCQSQILGDGEEGWLGWKVWGDWEEVSVAAGNGVGPKRALHSCQLGL